ncbi:MAG: hypothetical protein EPN47_03075 [Acidobacteria bacterium]|nr:MAG: hypothetical protein EPN47_03075 [Acidobacteriota bacterium]
MSRKAWLIFLSVQAIGITFSWAADYTLGPSPLTSGIGVGFLVVGNLLLLPGGLLAAFAVQRVLLYSGLSNSQLSLTGVVAAIAINLGIWLLFAKLHRSA